MWRHKIVSIKPTCKKDNSMTGIAMVIPKGVHELNGT